MKIIFHPNAWEDYVFWQSENKKNLKKENKLIKAILREPYEGIGKPEPLKFDLSGFWSRRIDQEHRIVYRIRNDELHVLSCRHHY
ncbi:MAG: Txe/YoeB family addiction module toxin [Deltaproteobacteria bacterium]|nr:Txe/YoeB family addiction module toxin [Deltaproteobacteria bacterium]MBT4526606.1 Txe/YoeB family addiction module toxin [Deltaproteobacteria bacterium]